MAKGGIASKAGSHVIAKAVKGAGVRKAGKVAARKKIKSTSSRVAHNLYARPSKFRKGVRNQVWQDARGADGNVRDPLTGKVMNKSEPWDMGHKPGYEFRKHAAHARQTGMSRQQFLDEHNDPTHYRPELPESNQSHQDEDHTGRYLGGGSNASSSTGVQPPSKYLPSALTSPGTPVGPSPGLINGKKRR